VADDRLERDVGRAVHVVAAAAERLESVVGEAERSL
jgi:hypothetical protein